MAEGNAGVFDYTGIKAILDQKGYVPIYPVEKPRCPRWVGQTCSKPCKDQSDCYNEAGPERKIPPPTDDCC